MMMDISDIKKFHPSGIEKSDKGRFIGKTQENIGFFQKKGVILTI